MLTINYTNKFKKDFKRISKGRYNKAILSELPIILEYLTKAEELPSKYHDHALIGNWVDCRDLHIRADLVLIYRINDDNTIDLVRLGTHSDLNL